MLLQRKNDSRDASVRSRHCVNGARRRAGRVLLDAEQELRRHEQALQRELDAGVEALLGAVAIEREQRRDVVVGRRAGRYARRASVRQDLARAGFGSRRVGVGSAAGTRRCARRLAVSPAPVGVVRAADLDGAQIRAGARLGNVHAGRIRPLERQPRRLVERGRAREERRRDRVRAGADGHAHAPVGVGAVARRALVAARAGSAARSG